MKNVTIVTLFGLLSVASEACSIVNDVKMTFYGYPDNSPPGSLTAHDCNGGTYYAGGSGTYSDPLTFASDSSEYSVCEIIYAPYLRKYLIMQDDCAQCGKRVLEYELSYINCLLETDWERGIAHIDVWTGSSTSDGGQDQINCEDDLTPGATQTIIRNPAGDLPVDRKSMTLRVRNTMVKNTASVSLPCLERY